VARRDHRRRTVAIAWLLGELDGTVQVPREWPPASPASSRRSRTLAALAGGARRRHRRHPADFPPLTSVSKSDHAG
jgi:hypothetical protein